MSATDPIAPAATSTEQAPRFALFIATSCGLGYLPKAPGTWGSLGGVLAFVASLAMTVVIPGTGGTAVSAIRTFLILFCLVPLLILLLLSCVGVWAAERTAGYLGQPDPQIVVIDEVSGQYLTLLFGTMLPFFWQAATANAVFYSPGHTSFAAIHVNWKYLLLGFILFRAFDIWKPFPARQAERLPGGWGIMADDWVAGIYAALGLWIARMLGL